MTSLSLLGDIAPHSSIKCRRRLAGPERTSDLDTSRADGAPEEKDRHGATLYEAFLPRKRRAVKALSVRPPCPPVVPPPWRGRSAAGAWPSPAHSRAPSAPGAADGRARGPCGRWRQTVPSS